MKKIFAALAAAAIIMIAAASCSDKGAVIRTDVPARVAGQDNVIGLRCEPLDTVRIGVVGLGMRGSSAVRRLTLVPGVKITALCDIEPERAEKAQETLRKKGLPEAALYSGEKESWRGLCSRSDVDLVYICTDWSNHVPVALCAMESGKHTAIEVPAATTLKEIWSLVNTAEKTRRHCMMLENCVYDFFELTTLQMARKGLFGEIIHAEGAYLHNLDPFWDEYWDNWRLDYNRTHRGDVYPTHGIGPVCQALNIHRGDRMKTLVAMDTDPFNGPELWKARKGEAAAFEQGDQTSTLIRTEKGKTILIEHDVMTPRPYSRMYQLVGTEGYAGKYPTQVYCLREKDFKEDAETVGSEKTYRGAELKALQEPYRSPILTPEFEALAKEVGGHGGMDYIMDYRLIYCLRHGLPLDMDVYDMAEWCCISELSRISIENGNAPVEVPDFTRGAWETTPAFDYAFAKD